LAEQKPTVNFSKGLFQVEIPELGESIRGKVRDNWVIDNGKIRIMVTTDRQSVNAKSVCTIPGKGQISNLISAYWFEFTKDIVSNNMIATPHPNVLFARQAVRTIPIEVVARRYMAKSDSKTSIYYNYFIKKRRHIYGINFPEGLKANEELPWTIVTPTTKAPNGIDEELTDEEAMGIVDLEFGKGTWKKVKDLAIKVFEKARIHALKKGLILSDTKFEFGFDGQGRIMLIDELLTPECSRYWIKSTYKKRISEGKNPEPYKDVLVDWMAKHPSAVKIDPKIIKSLLGVYKGIYKRIALKRLPKPESNPKKVKRAILDYIKKQKIETKR
jgi:phosphoribosylaminoimidazole-succinocarboxamide synthase